jgi:hypothetical protein
MNPLKIFTYALFTGLRGLSTVQTRRKIFRKSGHLLRIGS